MAESVNDFIAGLVGGTSGVVVTHPLDVVRIRQQVGTGPSSIGASLAQLYRIEGLRGLYRGLLPPVAAVGGLNCILFGAFGISRRALRDEHDERPLNLKETFLCGSFSGFFACLISGPSELVKCRMQVSKVRMTSPQAVREIVQSKGLIGLARGLGTTIVRDVPSFGLYFFCYELFCRLFSGNDGNRSGNVGFKEFVTLGVAGGLAGCISWTSIYPIDTVKTVMQTQSVNAERPMKFWDAAKLKFKNEGLVGFRRGLGATVLRAFPLNGITLAVYESTLRTLDAVWEE